MIKNNRTARKSLGELLELHATMSVLCDNNDLVFKGVVSRMPNGRPELAYTVCTKDDVTLYAASAWNGEHIYTKEVMNAISGRTVSPVCPPAVRQLNDTVVCYWRRLSVIEHFEEERPGVSVGNTRYSAWAAYSRDNKEIGRIHDGMSNPGFDNIDRVDLVDLGPLGKVFAVVPHEHKRSDTPIETTMGEDIKFKEHLDREKRRKEQDEAAKKLSYSNGHLQQAGSSAATVKGSTAQSIIDLVPETLLSKKDLVPTHDKKQPSPLVYGNMDYDPSKVEVLGLNNPSGKDINVQPTNKLPDGN